MLFRSLAPEFQIFTPPFFVGYLNGMQSLIKNGVSHDCYRGENLGMHVHHTVSNGHWRKMCPQGSLAWQATGSAKETVDELDVLLTGGRLSPRAHATVQAAFEEAPPGQGLQAAQQASLDLVQIADSDPIVCKIMDYGKKVFEEKKQKAAQRKKQKQTQVKEIKMRPGTEEGDYQVKLRNLIRFLESGDKAKVTIRYRGREMAHQEIGMQLLNRIETDLEEYGAVEQRPKMEGRQMMMVLAPKKKK